jgi:hypothetical protein
MGPDFDENKADEWVALLHSGNLHERCEAALTLAEFAPLPRVRKSLLAALDAETPIKVAAIGLIEIPPEARRRLLDGLRASDEEKREQAFASLEGFAHSERAATASDATEFKAAGVDAPPRPLFVPMPDSVPAKVMDITVVSVLPWWFLGLFALLIVGFAWLTRGIWWPKWAMAGLASAASAYLIYSCTCLQNNALSAKRFHARARLTGAAILAGACGFGICTFLPLGAVLIDNESRESVRLMIDGTEWLTIEPGETRKSSLPAGTHRLVIVDQHRERTLDAHDIDVAAHRQHVLNVLGGQIYFQGIVQYGIKGGATEVITAKWFLVPEVDYLFKDPPESIVSVNPVNKSFLTKGRPPLLKGGM